MGNICCPPASPCGSAEERSGLLKDDVSKAAGPTCEAVVVLGTCCHGADDDIRKPPDEAAIKVKEAAQVKQSPEMAEAEPNNTPENGPSQTEVMQTEVMQTATPSPCKGSELKENAAAVRDEDAKDRPAGAGGHAELTQCALESLQEERAAADPEVVTPTNAKTELENPALENDKIPGRGSPTAEEVCPENLAETNATRENFPVDEPHSNDDNEEEGSKVLIENTVAEPSGEFSQNNKGISVPNPRLPAAAGQTASSSVDSREKDRASPIRSKSDPDAQPDVERTPTSSKEVTSSTEEEEVGKGQEKKEDGLKVEEEDEIKEEERTGGDADLQEVPGGEEQRTVSTCPDVETPLREEEEEEEEDVSDEEGTGNSEEDLYRGAEEQSAPQNNEPETTVEKVEDRGSVGPVVETLCYSEREWKGNTAKSALIRKGYKEMSQRFGGVRRVRGDNYCALRATLYQVLSHSTRMPAWLQDRGVNMLWKQLEAQEGLFSQWTFPAECLQGDGTGDASLQLKGYVELLRNKWRAVVDGPSAAERRQLCERLFQGGEEELGLLEALKLLMLGRAVELHGCMTGGGDVPLFCWLLFARDSSGCPRSFLSNHLSHVGLGAGLEQVEMFLLGYALQCTIQVYRLYKAGTEEFVTYYPDDHKDDWPPVCLVTEDDRHYNVPVADAAGETREPHGAS
uniref:OTU deubiquitinase with linear linkage specificity a n=1 Tax=Gasterosteus aculeatus aculeatus TaxID=481459 RepID=A0AAQ4Q601_GASAC|nr:cyclic nucleotide-gated cation channel beta-1 isoform X2 [Gasterosteus aculeatus aculeatus]